MTPQWGISLAAISANLSKTAVSATFPTPSTSAPLPLCFDVDLRQIVTRPARCADHDVYATLERGEDVSLRHVWLAVLHDRTAPSVTSA
jgi:hypothetical protein